MDGIKGRHTLAARGLEELFFSCQFLRIFLLNPNFLLVHRNRHSEGMDDGQKTPRGHPDLNSYVKILRVFITDRQADGQRN